MKTFFMAASVLLLSLTSCSGLLSDTVPSTEIEWKTIEVDSYDAIELESGFNVEIASNKNTDNDSPFIRIKGNKNLLDNVYASVKEGTLYLRMSSSVDLHADGVHLCVYVSPKELQYLKLEEGAHVFTEKNTSFATEILDLVVEGGSVFDGSLLAEELNTYASGGSKIEIEGEFSDLHTSLEDGSEASFEGFYCNRLEGKLENGSKLHAFELCCKTATISMTNGSLAEIYATEKIYATNLSGGSSLYYVDYPQIIKGSITGGSTIVDAN